jgi:thiamine biosynthesis lipoprotein ApbE
MPALGEILSVSIVATDCALADAWATGVMASGTEQNARRLLAAAPAGMEYYIIVSGGENNGNKGSVSGNDGSVSMRSFHSPGFPLVK